MSTRSGRIREHERLEAVRLGSAASAAGAARCCAWPGCEADGAYRAPLSRDRLREYQFLCLEHVRAFNQKWNFFAGMSPAEIEAHQKADTTWHRPSWRFGTAPGGGPDAERRWDDPLGVFGDQAPPRRPPSSPPPTKAQRMMAVLDLEDGFTLAELKTRYKSLAKLHHPDLHGGDKAAEERLKVINEAYTYLRGQRLYA